MTQPIERESMNFRLPKPIAEALRNAASSQPGKTATDIVIRALIRELGDIQGVEVSTETRLKNVEKSVQQLADSIKEQAVTPTNARMEEKLEALNNRVAKLEGALGAIQNSSNFGASRGRRYQSFNPYNQTGRPPQIQPLDEQKLALRLNVKIPELQEKQTTLGKKEFEEWSQNRDRGKYPWTFNKKDCLYHPKKPN